MDLRECQSHQVEQNQYADRCSDEHRATRLARSLYRRDQNGATEGNCHLKARSEALVDAKDGLLLVVPGSCGKTKGTSCKLVFHSASEAQSEYPLNPVCPEDVKYRSIEWPLVVLFAILYLLVADWLLSSVNPYPYKISAELIVITILGCIANWVWPIKRRVDLVAMLAVPCLFLYARELAPSISLVGILALPTITSPRLDEKVFRRTMYVGFYLISVAVGIRDPLCAVALASCSAVAILTPRIVRNRTSALVLAIGVSCLSGSPPQFRMAKTLWGGTVGLVKVWVLRWPMIHWPIGSSTTSDLAWSRFSQSVFP